MATFIEPFEPLQSRRARAEALVLKFTLAAMATGGVPVPAASAAIVAENVAMVNAVASAMGVEVSMSTVATSLGAVGGVNMVGRALFVEAARALGWFAGPLGVAAVMALGASTAGLQTWVLGKLAIAISESGGRVLPAARAERVLEEAKEGFRVVERKPHQGVRS